MRRCGARRALTATASCPSGVWTAGTSKAWRWSARSRARPVKATKPRQRRFVKARRLQNSSAGFGGASALTLRASGRHGWLDLQGWRLLSFVTVCRLRRGAQGEEEMKKISFLALAVLVFAVFSFQTT